MTIKATSDAAFRRLIGRIVSFYGETPVQSALGRADRLPAGQRPRDRHGVPRAGPAAGGGDLAPVPRLAGRFAAGLQHRVSAMDRGCAGPALLGPGIPQGSSPAWCLPTTARAPPRPTCSGRAIWSEAGQVLHGYQSAWLPASLLQPDRQEALGDALFAASRHWGVSLHLNKGLAGAPAEAIAAARDTAMNPAVLDAFALVISGGRGAAGLSRHSRSRARSAGRSRARGGDRPSHERDADAAPDRRLLRRGERFLRARRGGNPSGARTTRGCSP